MTTKYPLRAQQTAEQIAVAVSDTSTRMPSLPGQWPAGTNVNWQC